MTVAESQAPQASPGPHAAPGASLAGPWPRCGRCCSTSSSFTPKSALCPLLQTAEPRSGGSKYVWVTRSLFQSGLKRSMFKPPGCAGGLARKPSSSSGSLSGGSSGACASPVAGKGKAARSAVCSCQALLAGPLSSGGSGRLAVVWGRGGGVLQGEARSDGRSSFGWDKRSPSGRLLGARESEGG